jgi:hypothetical protein
MTDRIFCPNTGNLSLAWAILFQELMNAPGGEIGPVSIVIDEFDQSSNAVEIPAIRTALDQKLVQLTHRNCEDIAGTIFPYSLWNPSLKDEGEHVYARYANIWPRLKKRSPSNARGNYFQRLVDFEDEAETNGRSTNQLKTIVANYKKTHRRSALQATIFDPQRDLAPKPMQGFPCLQQVAFSPTKKGLIVTGFYVLQYVFERGYGNYLGLCRLGAFMAQQLDMPLLKVVTMLSFAKYANEGQFKKSDFENFMTEVKSHVPAV